MLEEKSKMIEVMNEANSVYEGSMRRSLTADPNMANEFNARTSLFMNSNTDLSEIIKPEYIDGASQNQVIENLPQDVKIKMVAHSDACTALAFSPLGDTLATGGADKCVRLWNVKKMNEGACLRNKTHSICAVAFSLDNSLLMSCSTDHRATLYNLRGNIKTQTSFTAHQDLITSTKFCFSTKSVATSSMDSTIKFWDITNGNLGRVINTYSKVYDMHVSRSETYIVTGHNDMSIRVWNAKSKEQCFKIEDAHADPVACVRITSDENYIVSTSKDDTIKVWDLRKHSVVHTFEHELFRLGSNTTRLCISPNS